MYNIKKKIKEIKSYTSDTRYAIQNGYIYDLNKEKVIFTEIENQFKINTFSDKLLISNDIRGNSLIIDICNKTYNQIEKINSFKYPFYQTYTQEEPRVYKLNNFQLKKILFETNEWIGRDIIGDYIFSNYNGLITCRKVTSATPIWQFNLEQLGAWQQGSEVKNYEVVSFIGVWQNTLIVMLSNCRIIALDVTTSKLLHDVALANTYAQESGYFISEHHTLHLDEENKRLIFLSQQTLVHIALENFTHQLIKEYQHVPRAEQWQFKKSTFYKGQLYFVADYGWQYVVPTHLDILNPNNGEVLWSTQLKKTKGLLEPPQVSGNKLYQITGNKELYIFEKEELEIS